MSSQFSEALGVGVGLTSHSRNIVIYSIFLFYDGVVNNSNCKGGVSAKTVKNSKVFDKKP